MDCKVAVNVWNRNLRGTSTTNENGYDDNNTGNKKDVITSNVDSFEKKFHFSNISINKYVHRGNRPGIKNTILEGTIWAANEWKRMKLCNNCGGCICDGRRNKWRSFCWRNIRE